MATSIRDVLGDLAATATDARDKGDKFERLIAGYLRTDASWADRFSKSGFGATGPDGTEGPTPASTWSPRNGTPAG